MFVTLPLAFASMPAGSIASLAFYLLLFAAALASAISLLELVVAPLVSRGWSRPAAAALSAISAWALGIATILSSNRWADWRPLALVPRLADAGWFEALDYVTSNLMLPVGGFALAVFAGWIVPSQMLAREPGLSRAALLCAGCSAMWSP